jgi:tricorn protease
MTCLFAAFGLSVSFALASTQGGIPRQPDLADNTIVFTAGGDLWTVPVAGGNAKRLTSHQGVESYARFSPNGETIAYTADYDGDSNVWLIPTDGGAPDRLTWHATYYGDDLVWDWTPDGESVLFSSRYRTPNSRYMELFSVPTQGGLPNKLPISDVGAAKVGADGQLIFNRHFRNFRSWKRYRGGMQQDLWSYDPNKDESERLTTFEGTDTHPMIAEDGTVYFVSDRPTDDSDDYATRNIYRLEGDGLAMCLTDHTDADVDWPSLDGHRIVYMHKRGLRVLDLNTKTSAAVSLRIPDEAHDTRPQLIDARWEREDVSVGPQAKRVAMVAHGHLFTVPAENGAARHVAGDSSSRITRAAWSPDGKQLAYVTDTTGEQQIWLIDQSGKGSPRQLTNDNDNWILNMGWSPDGKRIYYTDKRMRLFDVSVATGSAALVDLGKVNRITDASYSRDGSLLTYVKPEENGYGSIWIHSVNNKENYRITDSFNNDFSPAFDPKGRYLYFASQRNFDLVGNAFEWRYVHRLTDLLYVVRLFEDSDDPLGFESDEEIDGSGAPVFDDNEDDKKEKKKSKRAKQRKNKRVVLAEPTIAFTTEGIADRLQRLPIGAGSYGGLSATEDGLLYMSYQDNYQDTALRMYALEDREDKTVLSGVSGYELTFGGEKLLVSRTNGGLGISPVKPDASFKRIPTVDLDVWTNPKEEWAHALDEVRRYMRDYFYDPGMHGHDWDSLHERYVQWLDAATHLSDVHYIIREYMGELNAGHAYVRGVGRGMSHQGMGFLGADLEANANGVQITNIFRGEPGDGRRESPLRAPGVDANEGDYLIAINGQAIGPNDNPYRWLVGTAGKPVTLSLNSQPTAQGAREVEVFPARSESQLRYWDWVETNRARVDEASDGKIGYIHVPNTSTAGYTEFVRGLYALHRKEGLIFDVRYNGGGFIPEMFIEHLLRPHYNTWVPRDGTDWRTPAIAHHGPKAAVTNGYAGSGGDAFPYYFRQFELGPLVGTTTWGGLVGIDNNHGFRIGGSITAPSFAFVNAQGEWDVERVGVAPDVEIWDPPEARGQGEDPQLDAAIAAVLKALESWEDPVPKRPAAFPVRP